MATQLDWVYQDHASTPEFRAEYKGLVIRAIHDDDPENPFEDGDGNWPISVRSSDGFTDYDGPGLSIRNPLGRFGDALLIHLQVHIAKALNTTVNQALDSHFGVLEEVVNYCRDADTLRDAFEEVFGYLEDRELLDTCLKLYELLGIPAYLETTSGYCQGDTAEVLVVATPEVVAKFGTDIEHYRVAAKAHPGARQVNLADLGALEHYLWGKSSELMLEGTVKLYGAWAWGDVYGYQLARAVLDEDGEEVELEDLDDVDSSCWGFYGDEFDWSGLEDAAIEAADRVLSSDTKQKEAA
jgi:hypothetical protein